MNVVSSFSRIHKSKFAWFGRVPVPGLLGIRPQLQEDGFAPEREVVTIPVWALRLIVSDTGWALKTRLRQLMPFKNEESAKGYWKFVHFIRIC